MSWQAAAEPVCRARRGEVALVVEPRVRDLGGFEVRRVLPASARAGVGPFVFFDEMGPADFPPGRGLDVRPHPHIGLSTVTYLFEGEILHRDGLGFVQPIRPGAVNLMTAGRGIVHSERSDDRLRARGFRLHGIQSWMALPDGREEIEPSFSHHPATDLPDAEVDGARVRVILGEAFGMRSPVPCPSPAVYVELRLSAGAEVALPPATERAVYVVEGPVAVGACRLEAHTMGVLDGPCDATLRAEGAGHVVLIGGEPVGERHLWWNFVSSSPQRIARAKRDWAAGAFAPVPGESESIPLPEGGPT